MLSISCVVSYVPESVKNVIIDFKDVKLKSGVSAIRVTMDRLLTDEEKEAMRKNKHILGVDCVCTYRWAPEIKQSYFYVSSRIINK